MSKVKEGLTQEGPQVSDSSALYTKILRVKEELGAVTKNAKNPYFKSNYADLNAHLEAVEPILHKNGLVLCQPVEQGHNGTHVRSAITDVDTGLSVSSILTIPALDDMQKLGGAITYARRYTLGSLLSMRAEDDDGNTATGKWTAGTPQVKQGPKRGKTTKQVSREDF